MSTNEGMTHYHNTRTMESFVGHWSEFDYLDYFSPILGHT